MRVLLVIIIFLLVAATVSVRPGDDVLDSVSDPFEELSATASKAHRSFSRHVFADIHVPLEYQLTSLQVLRRCGTYYQKHENRDRKVL